MDPPGFRLLSQESPLSPFDAPALPLRQAAAADAQQQVLTPGQAAMLALGAPQTPAAFDVDGYFVSEEAAGASFGHAHAHAHAHAAAAFFDAGMPPPPQHAPAPLRPSAFGGPFVHPPPPARFGHHSPPLAGGGLPAGETAFARATEASASTDEGDDDGGTPGWARRPPVSAKEVVRRRRERRRRAAAMAAKRRELARRGAARGDECEREERTVEKRTKKQIRTRENLERYRNKIKDKERRLAEEHEDLLKENACLRRLLGRLENGVYEMGGTLV